MPQDGTALGDKGMAPSGGVIDVGRDFRREVAVDITVDRGFDDAGQLCSAWRQGIFVMLLCWTMVLDLQVHGPRYRLVCKQTFLLFLVKFPSYFVVRAYHEERKIPSTIV